MRVTDDFNNIYYLNLNNYNYIEAKNTINCLGQKVYKIKIYYTDKPLELLYYSEEKRDEILRSLTTW